jgi:hypothetical protein
MFLRYEQKQHYIEIIKGLFILPFICYNYIQMTLRKVLNYAELRHYNSIISDLKDNHLYTERNA